MARNDLATLTEVFRLERLPVQGLEPNFNTAPTQRVYVVAHTVGDDDDSTDVLLRRLAIARWGLIPSWAKDRSIGSRLINARAETIGEKPSFRRAFARRRCLVPLDGFYEWQASSLSGQPKQPFFIHPAQATTEPEAPSPVGVAGLYEWWRDPAVVDSHDAAAWVLSCTVITTAATGWTARVHDRMPIVVAPAMQEAWLNPALTATDEVAGVLAEVLAQAGSDPWVGYPVATRVNKVANNDPSLLMPLTH